MATSGKAGSFALSASLGHLLHRAQQAAADRFAEVVPEEVLTLRQFALLAAVAERSGQTQTALVQITGIDRSTLADMIRRLELRGLVARKSATADKRANAVSLTTSGARTLSEATPAAIAADAALMALLPKSRRDGFLAALQVLASEPEAEKLGKGAGKRKKKKAAKEGKEAKTPAAETPPPPAQKPAKKLKKKERQKDRGGAKSKASTTPAAEKPKGAKLAKPVKPAIVSLEDRRKKKKL